VEFFHSLFVSKSNVIGEYKIYIVSRSYIMWLHILPERKKHIPTAYWFL